MTPTTRPTMDELRAVATAICKSRTCEGVNCCQWPANGGRRKCAVRDGCYDDAARDALAAMSRTTHAGEGMVEREASFLLDAIEASHRGGETFNAAISIAAAGLKRALSPSKPAPVVE